MSSQPATAHRFEHTYCSQCGGEFGPGDEGYSHCSDHNTAEHDPGRMTCLRCVTPKKCAIHGCCPGTWPSEAPTQASIRKDEAEARGVTGNHWTIFNRACAVERENCSLAVVRDYMTPERMERGWTAVHCVVIKTQAELDALGTIEQSAPPERAELNHAYEAGLKDGRAECERICAAEQAENRELARGSKTPMYDWMADGAGLCLGAIRSAAADRSA